MMRETDGCFEMVIALRRLDGSGMPPATGLCVCMRQIARENGKTIHGLLRGDLMPSKVMEEIPLGHLITGIIGGSEYPVADADDPQNQLTVRDSREAKRTTIPRTEWQFAHMVDGKLVASDRHIHLNGGFQPGRIYEYIYAVQDPVVAGLGFAAVRDFAAYAKHSPDPLVSATRVYGEGISQNGRFLRDLLYQGFNADEEGRMALDGVLAHVAGAGRGSFNIRFAQPSRDAQPTSSVFFRPIFFRSLINRRQIRSRGERAAREDCSIVRSQKKSCLEFFFPILLTSTGGARPR